MVDFKKRLAGKKTEKITDPIKLYDTLDRAHDKGPLRPAQAAVLAKWFETHSKLRDVVVKLHTGQGKTLIGLLILQSRLNEGAGPAVYLCPDHLLITQTCEQARQFGIPTCIADPELPDEFFDGSKILVTSVQKLFNGITRFGLNKSAVSVGTVLLDDAHACADIVREACRIRISSNEPAYHAIQALFADELEAQGAGTWADILNDKRDALLPVPYWAWKVKETEVANVLSKGADRKSIKYSWPLLKDMLNRCKCAVSGNAVEIEPYIAPLEAFGSYWNASHRVFMSATVTDDAFLVKGLRLLPETIANPLSFDKETWSGEKMLLLPSLINEDLNREEIVAMFAKPNARRRSGVVALAPSYARTKDWEGYGAEIAKLDAVEQVIQRLKSGGHEHTVVLVNRYDGIDLPDEACRILVFDSKPFSESLSDLYEEQCRPNSDATLMRTVRTVEQGMGRSVRGEKDYCVIIAIGSDLVRLLRDRDARKYLSPQMSAQIQIGLEIADMAKQEIEEGEEPRKAFVGLINQCLTRDDDWKAFYVERMDQVVPVGANEDLLRIYAAELRAEQAYASGDYASASQTIQTLLDGGTVSAEDKGWYLQEMARYNWRSNRPESERLQIAAHKQNRMLLKPHSGVTVAKLTIVSTGRIERIVKWINGFADYSELNANVSDILSRLSMGTKADTFEAAFDELSFALGFVGERPDKHWKEGPDNLWALDATKYLLWECKSEVEVTRAAINKREAEQMNRSSVWFDKYYPGCEVKRFIVHPTHVVESAAGFTHEVEAVRVPELKRLAKSVREFFKSFEALDFKDLSLHHIQQLIDGHGLSISSLFADYSKKLKDY